MKLSKERKLYLTIGAVAILGLAADRFLGASVSSPDAAAAALQVDRAVTSPTTGSEIDVTALNLRTDRSLPARLDQFAKDHQYELDSIGNGFSAGGNWLVTLETSKPDKASETVEDFKRSNEFKSTHKLTALMTGADGGLAVVNGTPLRPGQEIDSYKLVAIQGSQAVFECQGQAVVLELTLDPKQLLKSQKR